jgi:hypothetical protein
MARREWVAKGSWLTPCEIGRPTNSWRSQQTGALMILAPAASFDNPELLAIREQWRGIGIDGLANFVPW